MITNSNYLKISKHMASSYLKNECAGIDRIQDCGFMNHIFLPLLSINL